MSHRYVMDTPGLLQAARSPCNSELVILEMQVCAHILQCLIFHSTMQRDRLAVCLDKLQLCIAIDIVT